MTTMSRSFAEGLAVFNPLVNLSPCPPGQVGLSPDLRVALFARADESIAVWIDSHHPSATLDAFLSVSENPTSFNDFNTTSNGTAIPMVTNFFQVSKAKQ